MSGKALQGKFKDRQLTSVFTDEVTFAVWKREHPNGRVLRPDERVSKNYEAANWEEEYEKFKVVVPLDANDKLKPRALIAGIVVHKSVRAFERTIDGRTLEFFVKDNQFVDAETGSTWDFSGKATSGALAGKQLKKIPVLKDYWFDWKIYHPDTSVYTNSRYQPDHGNKADSRRAASSSGTSASAFFQWAKNA